jgi:hypothetical protein
MLQIAEDDVDDMRLALLQPFGLIERLIENP